MMMTIKIDCKEERGERRRWELREKGNTKELEIVEIGNPQHANQYVLTYHDFLSLLESDLSFQHFFTEIFKQGPQKIIQTQQKQEEEEEEEEEEREREREDEKEERENRKKLFTEEVNNNNNKKKKKMMIGEVDSDEYQNDHKLAMMWECRPIREHQMKTTGFSFVIIPSKALSLAKEKAGPFSQYFEGKRADEEYTTHFPNLERDAILLTPLPARDPSSALATRYTHLRLFLQTATPPQLQEFWQQLASLTRSVPGPVTVVTLHGT
jgi:hypothetical protein